MSSQSHQFTKDAHKIAFDIKHRSKIKFNIGRYDQAVAVGMARYNNVEEAKNRAANIKREMLQHWDEYLLEFEKNSTKNGAEVLWAENSVEALVYIKNILLENNTKLLVKSKSMTTEEIELNQMAESIGCESVETDLGEFIVQVAGEKPYHIVTPAMHKSKEEIAELFNEKFNLPPASTPEEITNYVRNVLRKKYTSAQVGVTGANFLISDVGGISVTENEGNGLMTTAFPKVHIVIAGIEKIIPKFSQLGLFYPLLSVHGTGQQMTAYNSVFTAPRKSNESDGAEKMYVILLDNGRTDVYSDKLAYQALSCIRCGACLNGCPVYRTIGGYTYNSTYSGPIGSVLTPFFKSFKEFGHLSFASTLCGKCNEVCPVKIPLTDILLDSRRKIVETEHRPFIEKVAMKGFKVISSDRKGFDIFPGTLKNVSLTPFNCFGWGRKRKMPIFANKSFSQQFREKSKK